MREDRLDNIALLEQELTIGFNIKSRKVSWKELIKESIKFYNYERS